MATWRRRSLIVLLACWASGIGTTAWANESCAALSDLPSQIRTSSCPVAEAVALGLSHSATFQRLVDQIGDQKGIVYVQGKSVVQPATRRVLDGTLQHRIVKAGAFRLLYITVSPGREYRHVATLAHELQHAIEVLDSRETTDAGVDRLFERIGTMTSASTFETTAAERAQDTVARELAASRAARR